LWPVDQKCCPSPYSICSWNSLVVQKIRTFHPLFLSGTGVVPLELKRRTWSSATCSIHVHMYRYVMYNYVHT
jgi:hypothetical protein